METTRRKAERQVGRDALDALMGAVFGGASHAQRVASLGDGVDGVRHAASLGVRAMGQGLAVAHGLAPRQAIKPVDRLVSHPTLRREEVARGWVRFVVAARTALVVHCDGTELQGADQAMSVLGTQTEHGRSTPLVWKTVTHAALQDQRNAHEDELLSLFAAVLPKGVRVTVVAERGFSDLKLDRFLTALGCDDIIRFRGVVCVASADGERRQAQDGRGAGGQMRVLRDPRVTAEGQPVPLVVCVQQTHLKAPWRLASRRRDRTGTAITHRDSTRFTVEETCRAVKPPRLGLGLKHTVMERNDRRDALFLLAVLAHTLLTRLGKAGAALGMDRWLGATRPRQYSRFRQRQRLFDLMPTLHQTRLRTRLQRFGPLLREHVLLSQVRGYLESI